MQLKPCKILVADDHAVVRKGVVQILTENEDLCVQGEAQDGEEMLRLLRNGEWDAVIMDLNMPGLNGLELIKQVHTLWPTLPILILSIHPESLYARRLLQAGASGYVCKECVTEELVAAVRKICGGGRYVSSTLAEQIAFAFGDSDRPPHEQLSDREFEVFCLLASGMAPSAIAEKLCLSAKTVSTYRSRILDKLNLQTNADMTRYGLKHGVIE